jgi:hypothetical protein
MFSPGRPVVAGRDQQRRFWAAIAAGMASEDAAVQAYVAGCKNEIVPKARRHATSDVSAISEAAVRPVWRHPAGCRHHPINESQGELLGHAPMKSFFGTLKTELVHPREYPDRITARRELFAYIEGYYNRARVHSAIGYITHSRQRQKPHNPVSTFPGEGHARSPDKCKVVAYVELAFGAALTKRRGS